MSGQEPRNSFRPVEAERDQAESDFTPILRGVFDSDPRVICVVFVDREGECIDYVSALPPFEAKVLGAHLLMLLDDLRGRRERAGVGEPYMLEIATDEQEVWARRVNDEYTIVALVGQAADRAGVQRALADACRSFRSEVGLPLPDWELPPADGVAGSLRVSVRPAVGWGYAPAAFRDADVPCEIAAVLGRWVEAGQDSSRVCFRVRTADGRELTLVHDAADDVWTVVH